MCTCINGTPGSCGNDIRAIYINLYQKYVFTTTTLPLHNNYLQYNNITFTIQLDYIYITFTAQFKKIPILCENLYTTSSGGDDSEALPTPARPKKTILG